jgi:hypothetical protein
MTPQTIAAAIIAFASFAGGWQIQSWRYSAKEADRVQQTLLATQHAAARAIRNTDNVIAAQNAAALRERNLRRDADRSRAAVVSLSDAAADALRRASTDHAACLVTAAAQNIVLTQCTGRYRDLAEIADRHASDVQTLIEAWPQ